MNSPYCTLAEYTEERRKENVICNNFVLLLDGAGANKQHSSSKDTAKLDRETEELHRKLIYHDVCLHRKLFLIRISEAKHIQVV